MSLGYACENLGLTEQEIGRVFQVAEGESEAASHEETIRALYQHQNSIEAAALQSMNAGAPSRQRRAALRRQLARGCLSWKI